MNESDTEELKPHEIGDSNLTRRMRRKRNETGPDAPTEFVLPGRASQTGNVVSFGKAEPVKQDDLLEERILYQKALRSFEKWQLKVREIEQALNAGATVEPGLYVASIDDGRWRNIHGFEFPIRRLVVR